MALRENYMLDFDLHRLIHAKDLNELSNYETQVFNILQCLQQNDLSGLMFWAHELAIEAKEDTIRFLEILEMKHCGSCELFDVVENRCGLFTEDDIGPDDIACEEYDEYELEEEDE